MSSLSLQFINKRTIGPEERRLIRSHVMKGKNAGRPRASRKSARETRLLEHASQDLDAQRLKNFTVAVTQDFHKTLELKRILWDDLALTSFPDQVTPQSRNLIHQWFSTVLTRLYPPEFCVELDVLDYVWFQYLLLDKAYFHCILAISASFADVFGGNVRTFPEALSHLSRAYELVHHKLSGPDATSDVAIAIVTTLAIYQRIHGQQYAGLTHFNGVCKMIELRGGLPKLNKENRALAQKPWRLDIEFALQDGSAPHFSANVIPHSLHTFGIALNRSEPEIEASSQWRNVDPKLLSILRNIAHFTKVLNNMPRDKRLDPLEYSENIFSLLHSLLQYAPLAHPRPENPLDNLVHLTLLALMTTLLIMYDPKNSRYELLSSLIRHALMNLPTMRQRNGRIFLWAFLTGSVSVWDDNDHEWLLPSMGSTLRDPNFHSWSDVQQILRNFPWIHALHDKPAEALWKKAHACALSG